jgi:hypothetical protein
MGRNVGSISFAAAILTALVFADMAGAFSGTGSGTESDPYIITNVNQLQEMNNDLDACYGLGNDIDASNTVSWNGGEGFVPIGSDTGTFSGVCDGQGHCISNLYENRYGILNYVGLFGYTSSSSEIKNIRLTSKHMRA